MHFIVVHQINWTQLVLLSDCPTIKNSAQDGYLAKNVVSVPELHGNKAKTNHIPFQVIRMDIPRVTRNLNNSHLVSYLIFPTGLKHLRHAARKVLCTKFKLEMMNHDYTPHRLITEVV